MRASETAHKEIQQAPVQEASERARRVLSNVLKNVELNGQKQENPVWPSVEVCENGDVIVIGAKLPSIHDVSVTFDDSLVPIITISGTIDFGRHEIGSHHCLSARAVGKFEWHVLLKSRVDAARVDACFEGPTLKIVAPKLKNAGN